MGKDSDGAHAEVRGNARSLGIDANLLVALHALLTHQNVTVAARHIGRTQSTMSHALARLRRVFGDPILVPEGRGLVLSARARGLVVPVAEAVGHLEQVFAVHEPFDPASSRRTFRITANDELQLYALPELAATLQQCAPGIEIRVGGVRGDWHSALERGEVDLALVGDPILEKGLESQGLGRQELGCVVRMEHPAPAAPSVQQYIALEHLRVAADAHAEAPSAIDQMLAADGLRRKIAMTVPQPLVGPFIVARSDLALTAPQRMLLPFVESLGLRWLELPFRAGHEIHQVWASRMSSDCAHRWIRERMASAAAACRDRRR